MTIGVAIVGLGMAHKPHIQSLRELADRVRIVACQAPSASRRETFARLHPDLPVTGDLDAVLGDRSVEAVILLTPPLTHHDLVARCAAAGKHVLLEKPLDVTAERARQSVDAMQRAGRTFGVVLQHRFRTAARRLASTLHSGELGRLVSGSASIRWWRSPEYFAEPGRGMMARDGGGVLITQAIHTLDLFQSLAGPIARVTAMATTSPLRRIDTEDIVAAAVAFENGAIGTIDATTVSFPGFSERIELACENGTAVLEAESLAVFYRDGRVERFDGGESKSGGADPMAFSNQAHKALIEDFLDAIAAGREPVVSGREALKVHQLIEALLQSSASGRPVALG
ncbi:Gfo/Idh/MocA family oxidoreductase [Bradyrhizobium sp. U87765 SZCCT0131]|uniref:Gfo/Idh/MocA family protein n=1 Tax=unclassified Bradyrhizobium TaxID=2631580 RepID=UPI001BA9D60A|nr:MULTISPECIES: Gfo/Idh/MocA family oxidoreductase [unclassified Bradyrhizobium]MBR1222533.1 Gfo/Idh/MocA family oxidoreductase [Bradyrhizobium sp. U87765 SZCCT0131]MBR1265386.1 Gfo/Idh/MocA family oxidoreductase [Bradyrhizobium sp. U87765 SZCCT0134]MBR1302835.1 Gfo/Idh/MocA family oxidoreductase [Bradyrhizobium sp. U87765 SZCCT0110]MBR1323533.1 Gfo/Idh/MocA family oxidoreductase [Bradyrhizobium sp. U87765 SZCCT0109]MBR1346764.1 Gfo/Idh/MocA family oxidoreductase [Bradyrhizobium sp. U87765 SZ